MYIIAIAWLYVTILMAATEPSITAGILTFSFYGLIPCGLLMWLLGTGHRKRRKALQASLDKQHAREQDGTHPKQDE